MRRRGAGRVLGWGRGLALLLLGLVPARHGPADELPAVGLSYRIRARIVPATRTLEGEVELTWKNPSDLAVRSVPVHLYLNAFAHEGTTWMRGVPAPRLAMADLLLQYPDPWGYTALTRVEQFTAGGARLASHRPIQPDDGNPLDRTLAEIALPEAVGPHAELRLRLAFRARFPVPIARTGALDDYVLGGQWYPKLGVLEPRGVRHAPEARWVARQFHGPTEFYADFADYDVTLQFPAGFLVGATGEEVERSTVAEGRERLVRFRQRAVHDFAFVLARGFAEERTEVALPKSTRRVAVRYLVPVESAHQLPRWRRAVEGALTILCRRVGLYPYRSLTVVLPPTRGIRTAGMEYPTLITGANGDRVWDGFPFGKTTLPELALIHEFGHQYFYGLLASHEMDEAFLDEGFNSYWEDELSRELYGQDAGGGTLFGRAISPRELRATGLAENASKLREALRKRPSWLFYPGSWGHQVYSRPAVTLATAAGLFGQAAVDRVFAAYFARFAFRHPDAEDFLGVAKEVGGVALHAFLEEAFVAPRLPDYRVAELESERWETPRGLLPTPTGASGGSASGVANPERGLDPAAREADGRVLMEVTDPGWVAPTGEAVGRVERRLVKPWAAHAASPRAGPVAYYESSARLEGPGWQHLPVEVELRFGDGVVLHDRWDGRAVWRRYRFVRPAPLTDVRVDPRARVALDVKPENNGRTLRPERRFLADWGGWLATLASWAQGALAQWL